MDTSRTALVVRVGVIAVVGTVLLSVLAPAGAIPQPNDTIGLAQTAGQQTVTPGETVTLEATINANGYNAPALSVDLPSGWTITGQSAEGPATFKDSTNEWVWLTGGEYTVTYTVDVPGGASDGDYIVSVDGSAIDPADDSFVNNGAETTISVQTQPANQPPTADAGSDQTVDEGTTVTLDATESSDDGSIDGFVWTQTGGPMSVSLSDASTAQPTFTAPDVSSETTLAFEVEVTDDDGSTDTDTVSVTVEDTDEPTPSDGISVTQSAQDASTVSPGGSITIEAVVDATGLNAPALDVDLPEGWAITGQSAEGPSTFKPSTNEWVWLAGDVQTTYLVEYTVQVPADAETGDYTIDADASALDDGDQLVTDTAQTTVTVTAPQQNQPPVADAGTDQTVDEDDSVTLDATGSTDPNGDTIAYEWTQLAGPTVTLSDASAAQPTFTAPDVDGVQTLTFAVEASDGQTTDTDTVTVTVEDTDGPPAGPTTDVVVSPPSTEVVSGATQTVDVVVESADGGVGAYTVTVSVSDSSAVSITDVELLGNPSEQTSDVQIAPDGSSATLTAALMDTADVGSVSIATVTLTGENEGSSDVTLAIGALGTEGGQSYQVTGTGSGTVTVITLGPVGDFAAPPTDPDGDGTYEDVNGDETFDIVDVQALFANLDDPTIQDNPGSFDFNDDGSVDVVDVQALYNELPQ